MIPKTWESRVLWLAGFWASFFGFEAIWDHQWEAFSGFLIVWLMMTSVYIFGRPIG